MGVWIEIEEFLKSGKKAGVTPFVGVWIEIWIPDHCYIFHPVTPFVGVWIEILSVWLMETCQTRHSLCGSVD